MDLMSSDLCTYSLKADMSTLVMIYFRTQFKVTKRWNNDGKFKFILGKLSNIKNFIKVSSIIQYQVMQQTESKITECCFD